jgi:hypothetical protein
MLEAVNNMLGAPRNAPPSETEESAWATEMIAAGVVDALEHLQASSISHIHNLQ